MEYWYWKREMRINAENVSNLAKEMANNTLKCNIPKINELKRSVQALEDMYENFKEVTP